MKNKYPKPKKESRNYVDKKLFQENLYNSMKRAKNHKDCKRELVLLKRNFLDKEKIDYDNDKIDENINQITNNSLNISTNDDYNIVLKIRNLNDKNEWIGDWSDKSKLWDSKAKSQVSFDNKDDGIKVFTFIYELFFS